VVAPMHVVGSTLSYTTPQVPLTPTLSHDAQRTILNAAFNVMDVNNDGKINSQDFAAIMNKPGVVYQLGNAGSYQPGNTSFSAPSLMTSYGTPTPSYSIPAGATSWVSPAPAVPCSARPTTYGAPSTIGVGMPTIGTYAAPSAQLTAMTYTALPQAGTTQPTSFMPQTTYAMPGAQMVLAQALSAPTALAQPSVPVANESLSLGQSVVLSSSIASSAAADATSVTFPAAPPTASAPVFTTSVPVPRHYVAPTTYAPPAVSYGMPAVTSTLSAPIVSMFCAAPMSATMTNPRVSVTTPSGELKQDVIQPAIAYTAPAVPADKPSTPRMPSPRRLASVTPVLSHTAPPATMTAVPVTAVPILASSVEANAYPVATSFVADQPLKYSTHVASQVMSNIVEQPVTNIAPIVTSNFNEQPVTYTAPTVTQVPPPMSCVTPVTSTVIEQPVTSTVIEQSAPFVTYTSPGTAAHGAEYSAPASVVAMDACGPTLSYPTTSMNMAALSMTYSVPLGTYAAPVTMAPVSYAVAAGSTPVATYSAATASSSLGMSLGPLNALGAPVVTPTVSAQTPAPVVTPAVPARLPASLMTPALVVNSAFNALDRNHDGMITRSEFNAALSQR